MSVCACEYRCPPRLADSSLTFTSQGMEVILRHTVILLEASPSHQLFNDGEVSETLRKVVCSEYISRDVFYGRCLGFQVLHCLLRNTVPLYGNTTCS